MINQFRNGWKNLLGPAVPQLRVENLRGIEDQRQRPGPGFLQEPAGDPRQVVNVSLCVRRGCDVNGEGLALRTALGLTQLIDRLATGSRRTDAINRLGRERDQPAPAQGSRGLGVGRRVRFADAGVGRGHVTATWLRGGAV